MKKLPRGIDLLKSGAYRARVTVQGEARAQTFESLEAAIRWYANAKESLQYGIEPAVLSPKKPVKKPQKPVKKPPSVLDVTKTFGRGVKAGTVRTVSGKLYKPSVSRRQESSMRLHVLPRIGNVPAASLTRRDVQTMVDELAAEKGPETARKALHALSAVMRLADRDGVIEENPCRGVTTPQSGEAPPEIRVLVPEEADKVLEAAKADDAERETSFAYPLISLALSTGLRLGELLALRWGPWGEDQAGIDLEAGLLRVRWNLDRLRDKETREYRMVRPKSAAGYREIPLSSEDVLMLKRHRLATGRPALGELLWADGNGKPLAGSGLPTQAWGRVRKSVPEPLPRFHDLRHTWCVFMLRAGVRAETIAKLGGWSDVGMIHRRYGKHALPEELATASDILAQYRASQRAKAS